MKTFSPTRILMALFSLFLLTSCKKDSLKDKGDELSGAKNQLVGVWEWQYSIREYNQCLQASTFYDTIYADNGTTFHRMTFYEKGEVRLKENDAIKGDFKIKFSDFYELTIPNFEDHYVFDIHLDNDPEQRLLGLIYPGGDSLYTWDYPFLSDTMACEDYKSFYFKL